MKKLNIACGNRFHNDWINIDFHKSANDVMAVNILNGLPFEDNSFDFVYSSHFIEHLTKSQADFVLSEMFRVLKREGGMRVVIPDMENICKEYLHMSFGYYLIMTKINTRIFRLQIVLYVPLNL